MKFSDFSNRPIGLILGCVIKYQSPETMRRRTGTIMEINFRGVRVKRPRDYVERVPFGLIDKIVKEVR